MIFVNRCAMKQSRGTERGAKNSLWDFVMFPRLCHENGVRRAPEQEFPRS